MTGGSKKRRVRSPSYPAINLGDAIERANIIYREEKWHSAPVDVIIDHWGYSKGSGAGLVQIAALKKYGLLTDEGRGGERTVKLSPLAREILIFDDPDERQKAITEAARKPTIYAEVLARYADGLPSDATLRSYLIKEKGFNDNVVDDLIKVMRETLDYANHCGSDIMHDTEFDSVDEEATTTMKTNQTKDTKTTGHTNKGEIPITVMLEGGSIRVVNVPQMTSAGFELFKQLLETYKPAIVRATANPGDSDE